MIQLDPYEGGKPSTITNMLQGLSGIAQSVFGDPTESIPATNVDVYENVLGGTWDASPFKSVTRSLSDWLIGSIDDEQHEILAAGGLGRYSRASFGETTNYDILFDRSGHYDEKIQSLPDGERLLGKLEQVRAEAQLWRDNGYPVSAGDRIVEDFVGTMNQVAVMSALRDGGITTTSVGGLLSSSIVTDMMREESPEIYNQILRSFDIEEGRVDWPTFAAFAQGASDAWDNAGRELNDYLVRGGVEIPAPDYDKPAPIRGTSDAATRNAAKRARHDIFGYTDSIPEHMVKSFFIRAKARRRKVTFPGSTMIFNDALMLRWKTGTLSLQMSFLGLLWSRLLCFRGRQS